LTFRKIVFPKIIRLGVDSNSCQPLFDKNVGQTGGFKITQEIMDCCSVPAPSSRKRGQTAQEVTRLKYNLLFFNVDRADMKAGPVQKINVSLKPAEPPCLIEKWMIFQRSRKFNKTLIHDILIVFYFHNIGISCLI